MIEHIKNFIHKLNTSQIITLGFAGVILLGGLILWLPICAAPGQTTSFSDAMFTATTSVCVTGLTTVTTATQWSILGKIVILILIQIGGIGVVSMTSLIFISFHKRISMKNRKLIQESYNLDQMSGMVVLVRKVVVCIFAAEAIGAVFYSFYFVPEFGWKIGIVQSVFTAISAFCNAGIDILGSNSLINYVENPLINITTMMLIILSGLGFTVWWDLGDKLKKICKKTLSPRRMFKTLRLHSKLVLITTGILLVGGTFLIFIFEYGNSATIGEMSFGKKLMASAFQSVTLRTAGFLTIDQASFTNASVILFLVLMFIGGSPMGTAGGVKTTTIAVMLLSLKANLQGKRDVEFAKRRIRSGYIRSAMVITMMGFLIVFVMSIALSAAMPEADMTDVIYEITSAAATVGLSRGLTGELNLAGKWIVIVTMFLGRIGPMTLGTAVLSKVQKHSEHMHLAEEDIMVG